MWYLSFQLQNSFLLGKSIINLIKFPKIMKSWEPLILRKDCLYTNGALEDTVQQDLTATHKIPGRVHRRQHSLSFEQSFSADIK